jgi:hypothetical protein
MIHGQDDEAARKWEEFQNQPTGGATQQRGRGCSDGAAEWRRFELGAVQVVYGLIRPSETSSRRTSEAQQVRQHTSPSRGTPAFLSQPLYSKRGELRGLVTCPVASHLGR